MTKKYVDFSVNREVAKYADSFAKIGNVGISKLDTKYTKALESVFRGNFTVSGKPLGNQKTFAKVSTKTDINDTHNVHIFHNFGILGQSNERVDIADDKDQPVIEWVHGESVEADIVANIIGACFELSLLANPIRENKTVTNSPRELKNKSRVDVENLKKPLKALGIIDGSNSRIGAWYANKTSICHEIVKNFTKELEVIMAIRVDDYTPPKAKPSTTTKLWCVSGCELNELGGYVVKIDQIAQHQNLLSCVEHGQNFSTEIKALKASKADKEIEAILQN